MNFSNRFSDERSTILPKVRLITDEISSRSERLFELSPRSFKKFVASLCLDKYLTVDLTQQSKDGGFDIIAISDVKTGEKTLIECKRYRRDRKIQVSRVRELLGVVMSERADRGLLVTTSSFTPDNREFISRNNWSLDGLDFDGLLDWLRDEQRARENRAKSRSSEATNQQK